MKTFQLYDIDQQTLPALLKTHICMRDLEAYARTSALKGWHVKVEGEERHLFMQKFQDQRMENYIRFTKMSLLWNWKRTHGKKHHAGKWCKIKNFGVYEE